MKWDRMQWWEPYAMTGCQAPMARGPSIEIKIAWVDKLQAAIDAVATSFAALGAAIIPVAATFAETTAAIRAFDEAFWASEHRRRIWFWRGLVGDERRLRWNCSHLGWWQAGRAAGELLAGPRYR